jgi:anti-sigma B factor antagonist
VTRFELTVQHAEGDSVRVSVYGSLDLAGAYDFDDAMRHVERDAPDSLVVDLRGLDFMDTAGLSRLLALRRRCRRAGRRLVLVRGPRVVHRLFRLDAFDEQFEIVSDPAEAAATR